MKKSFYLAGLGALVLGVMAGCTDDVTPRNIDMPDESDTMAGDPIPAEQFQQMIDVYSKALIDRDVQSLQGIVSKEINLRSAALGVDLAAFLDKQRASMFRTFGLKDDARPSFRVTKVVAEGDKFAVTLSLDGKELSKPTYFVKDGGEVKLNIAPPGFSKNNRGSSSYQIQNLGVPGKLMMCYSKNVYVDSGQTKTVSCTDRCGWWSGTDFQVSGGEFRAKCDWNSWGVDVIIDGFGGEGWHCNDLC